MMGNLAIDLAAFKALADTTRLDIVERLDARTRTVDDLARELALPRADVHAHLVILVSAGLAARDEETRRDRVTYRLTWKAQTIARPERRHVAVFLAFSAALLVSGFVYAATFLANAAQLASDANALARASGSAVIGADTSPILPLAVLALAGLMLASSVFATILSLDAWGRRGSSPLDAIREALKDG